MVGRRGRQTRSLRREETDVSLRRVPVWTSQRRGSPDALQAPQRRESTTLVSCTPGLRPDTAHHLNSKTSLPYNPCPIGVVPRRRQTRSQDWSAPSLSVNREWLRPETCCCLPSGPIAGAPAHKGARGHLCFRRRSRAPAVSSPPHDSASGHRRRRLDWRRLFSFPRPPSLPTRRRSPARSPSSSFGRLLRRQSRTVSLRGQPPPALGLFYLFSRVGTRQTSYG